MKTSIPQTQRPDPTHAPAVGVPAAHASRPAQIAHGSPQVQRMTQLHAIANDRTPPIQRQAQGSNLPGSLRSGIESLSGVSMAGVRVHYNSSKPAQLQAHAYAQGRDIHIAPRQERHLPHEAWHVVQQAQGRVKPTLQLKGVAINDDSALEREADVMGARALLGGAPGHTPTSMRHAPRGGAAQRVIIEGQNVNKRLAPKQVAPATSTATASAVTTSTSATISATAAATVTASASASAAPVTANEVAPSSDEKKQAPPSKQASKFKAKSGAKPKAKTKNEVSLESLGFFTGGSQFEIDVIEELLDNHPDAKYDTADEWQAEIILRAALVEGMQLINEQELFGYNFRKDEWTMPPTWKALKAQEADEGQNAAYMPADVASPKEAILNLFRLPEENEKYFIDCSFAIAAVHYRAMLLAFEAQGGAFDRTFKRKDIIINAAGSGDIDLGNQQFVPPTIDNFVTEIDLPASLNDLMPGDWVYFENFSDYDQTHSGPAAAWAGEHSIYMGQDRYQGFGTESLSHKEMVDQLRDRYNKQAKNEDAKEMKANYLENHEGSITKKLPGITQVRRAKRPPKEDD